MSYNEQGRPIYNPNAPGWGMVKRFSLCHEIGHWELSHPREAKSKAVAHATSSSTSSTPANNTNTDGNNGNDNGDGDDGEEAGGGDDDDPSDIARCLPIACHFIFPSHFLSCLLLACTSWLFKESFLAAIPLIGLCALCAFPEKLQFLRGEVSSQGAKFEIRSKK
jgi:hypothetical protein